MPGISDILGTAAGGTPWGAIAQTGIGAIQSIVGGIKARKAQRQLENLQTPTYNQSKSILDYYNQALQRYNVNPYQSQLAQYEGQQADRSLAAGLGSAQRSGGGVGIIPQLIAQRNNSALKTGVAAEQQQNLRFSQLGSAAQQKAAEDRLAFQYNKLAPYEKQYNLLAMKAGANAQTANAGLQNIFGGLGNVTNYQLASQFYGTNGYNPNQITNDTGTYTPTYQQARKSGLLNFQ